MINGRLRPGDRLPTHRELAETLGLAVGTVTRGYAEAEKRGLARGVTGRGAFIAGRPQARTAFRVKEQAAGVIDCALVLPLYELDPDFGPLLRQLADAPEAHELFHYQPARGMTRHREAAVVWAGRYGVEASAANTLVCSGAQQALHAVFGGLFSPGERIVTEPLTYPGVLGLANLFRLRLTPAAMDRDGLDPDAVAAVCRKEGVRAIYTMPGLHNPTTAALTLERRLALVELARKHDLLLIEDDPYCLTLEDRPPPLAALAPERTVFVAGVSKILGGGLRVGYLVAPPPLCDKLAQLTTVTTWMASPLTAELAARLIESGQADNILAAKRDEALARHELASDILGDLDVHARPGGFFLWLRLPEHWRGEAFAAAARERGVEVLPAEAFAVGHARPSHAVRVSLAAAGDRERLARGLAILSALAREWPRPGRGIM